MRNSGFKEKAFIFGIIGFFCLSPVLNAIENRCTSTAHSSNKLKLENITPLDSTMMMRMEALLFFRVVDFMHVQNKSMNAFPDEAILKEYLDLVDPTKMFFTQMDIDRFIENHASYVGKHLMAYGDMDPGFALINQYRQRFAERVAWIQKRLDQPFDFNGTGSFLVDRKKASFCSNCQELDSLWEQRLTHELINELLLDASSEKHSQSGETSPSDDEKVSKVVTEQQTMERLSTAIDTLKKRYLDYNKWVQLIEPMDVQELFCNTVAQFYDSHTRFFSADSMDEFSIELKNSLCGIGAVLKDDNGTCIIQEIMAGGPAERNGQLRVGDKILAVAQGDQEFVNIQGMRLRHAVKLIRGGKGTMVRLRVQSDNNAGCSVVELIREEVKLEDRLASAKVFWIPDANQRLRCIGWIDVPAFYGEESGSTTEHTISNDVKTLIERLKQFSVEGLILDMRRNGGGLLTEAVNLSGLFLKNCPVVQIKRRDECIPLCADANHCVWEGPLLIVTSRFSASAAEIVSGALQVTNRALIFGDRSTHGKGTVQAFIELNKALPVSSPNTRLGAANVTIQKWYLPDGSSIQQHGVTPDMILPSIWDDQPIGEADCPHALPWDVINSMSSLPIQDSSCCLLSNEGRQVLLQREQKRILSHPALDWYARQLQSNREQIAKKTYSINLSERIHAINEERKVRQAFSDEEKTLLKTYSPIYWSLSLSHKAPKKNPNTKPSFDLFQYEALEIMNDWLQLLHPVITVEPQWCYGQVVRKGAF